MKLPHHSLLHAVPFPVTLPKLCVLIKVVTPVEEPLSALKVRILIDDEILQEINADDPQDTPKDWPMSSDGKPQQHCRTAQFNLTFSPMRFEGPCILRVRAHTKDKELRGLALKVGLAPPAGDSAPDQPGE